MEKVDLLTFSPNLNFGELPQYQQTGIYSPNCSEIDLGVYSPSLSQLASFTPKSGESLRSPDTPEFSLRSPPETPIILPKRTKFNFDEKFQGVGLQKFTDENAFPLNEKKN